MSTPPPTCLCGSGLPQSDCHDPLFTEHYVPIRPRELFFVPPSHIPHERLRSLAEDTTALGGGLRLELRGDGRLSVGLSGPLQHMRHYPVSRQAATQVRYWPPPLTDAAAWPDLDLITPERLQQCRDALSAHREVNLEWLRRIRGAFVGIIVKNSPAETLAAFNEALPLLLHVFPAATVDCIVMGPSCIFGPRGPSVLASLKMQPVDEINARFESKKVEYSGPHYVYFDPGPYFSILHNLAFPYLTGFSFNHAGYSLQVDFGEPLLIPPNTRDDRDARDVSASLLAPSSQQSSLVPRFASSGARHLLRAWLTRRLNHLFAHLTAPSTFSNADGEYDPEQQWQDMLTVNDIVALTGLLLTEFQPTTTRLLFFDLMDRYSVLHNRAGNLPAILNAGFVERLADAMDPGLGPLQKLIAQDLKDAWAEVRDSLWSGLLDEGVRAGSELVIRAPDGREERHLSKDEFASELLTALRNTTHGYDLRGDQFRGLLVRHSCLLPEAVRYLALNFWFGFLSKPSFFWKDRADFDGLVPLRVGSPPAAYTQP